MNVNEKVMQKHHKMIIKVVHVTHVQLYDHTIDLCDEQTKSKLLFAENLPFLQQPDHGVNALNLRTV